MMAAGRYVDIAEARIAKVFYEYYLNQRLIENWDQK